MKTLTFLICLFAITPNAVAFDLGGIGSQLTSKLLDKGLEDAFKQDLDAVFADFSGDLLKGIDPAAKTAIQPFKTDNNQEKKHGETFNSRLVKALMDSTSNKIKIMERDQLESVWAEAEEFGNTEIEKLVKDAGTEVLIIGTMNKASNGYEVSYKGIDLRGSTGKIMASTKVTKVELQ
jgi:hypothetical protein